MNDSSFLAEVIKTYFMAQLALKVKEASLR
jgi:hypothetical protein